MISKAENNCLLTEQSLVKGKKYFEFYYNRFPAPWFAKCNFSREFIVTVNRCRAASVARIDIQ